MKKKIILHNIRFSDQITILPVNGTFHNIVRIFIL